MAFISSVNGNGNFGANIPPISGSSPLRPQDGICLSPRAIPQGNTAALAQAQLSLNLLYQQLLSGAAQSQLMPGPQPTILQNAQVQAQTQPQTFAVANPNQATLLSPQGLTLQQLLLHSNPLQQQIQALSQLLNPLVFYQQQFNSLFHTAPQANTVQVQNGLNMSLQQQRIMETFLAEQVAHNSALEKNNQQGPSRSSSVERNVARMNSDQLQEHISDLIKKNAAILEENQSQMKRRAYHRQVARQSSIEFQSDNRSQDSSPVIRDARNSVNRTQTLHEANSHCSIRAVQSGSLTNGQPVHRPQEKGFSCNYCQLTFANETALDAHELRCIKRSEVSQAENSVQIAKTYVQNNEIARSTVKSPPILHVNFENRHPLKRRLLAAVERCDDAVEMSSSKIAKLDLKANIKGVSTNSNIISDIKAQKTLESTASTYASTIYSVPQVAVTVESIPVSKNMQDTQLQEIIIDGSKPYYLFDDSAVRKGIAQVRRGRPRSYTNDTYVCQKAQPNYFEAKDNLSVYGHWQQPKVAEDEAKLNLLFMSTCSTKPRTGVKPHCRYTMAERELGAMKATHSSFWDFSTKIRLQQNAAAVACAQMTSNNLIQNRKLEGMSVVPPETSTASKIANIASCAATVSLGISQCTSSISPITSKKEIKDESIEIKCLRVQNEIKVEEPEGKYSEKLSLEKRIFDKGETSEVHIYVRGRGRGRYVCDRCGIRCKKPSMLKKHLKSHTDIRPFECALCNFSFKTKGNLTKHVQSKSHQRRITSSGQNRADNEENKESDGEQLKLEIVSNSESHCTRGYSILEQDLSSSDEEEIAVDPVDNSKFWPSLCKFGQENILIERATHTPPSFWLSRGAMRSFWPTCKSKSEEDEKRRHICYSAPPAVNFNLKEDMEDDTEVREKQSIACQNSTKTICATTDQEIYCQTNSVAHSSIGAFLTKEELTCHMCDRVFRKATELALHRHTHSIEQQNSRTRTYHCEECGQSFRSKSLLGRHLETLHCSAKKRRNQNEETAPTDPRSFRCTDCDIGFRKHGILSKHLRSKGHVAKLESQGKLPEDALSLISSDLSFLNQIDTKDCEAALQSLLGILNTLRDSTSLECREQLLQSPAPPSTNRFTYLSRKRSAQSFASTSARRASNASSIRQRDESFSAVQTDSSSALRKACEETPPQKVDDNEVKSFSANVWIPPKSDFHHNNIPLDKRVSDFSQATRAVVDSSALSDNVVLGSSVRSDEANSECAGRSESSTPTQRLINGAAVSPLLPTSTRCNVCDFTYETGYDLQVHLHADHVILRDGNNFCCPTKRCDKVYPTRESLRTHIAAHFYDGVTTLVRDSHDENENLTSMLTELNGTNQSVHRKLIIANSSSDHGNSVPNNVSPGVPEESRTFSLQKPSDSAGNGEVEIIREISSDSSGNKWGKEDSKGSNLPNSKRAVNKEVKTDSDQRRKSTLVEESCSSKPTPPGFLPCAICESSFPDALTLQKHWLSHVCYRPHICKHCDAGFTTADALNAHTATHINVAR